MISLLAENPLLLLFLVAAVGYPLGHLKLGGIRFGVAAVLFVGLAFGALDPRLALPEIVYQLGLVVFIYTVGLASAGGFFASLRRGGLKNNALALALLTLAAGLCVGVAALLGLSAGTTAGVFAGSLTNTPALASALEALGRFGEAVAAEPVVAYAVTYPGGVIGTILVIAWGTRRFRPDLVAERAALRDLGVGGEGLANLTVRVTRPDLTLTAERLREREGWGVILGRFRRDGRVGLVQADTVLRAGDEVSLIGEEQEVARAATFLGEVSGAHLEFDRTDLDFRRVFVSDPAVADRTLAELALPQRFGAMLTRVRRGDVELLPTARTRLELGDRVRVVARREQMGALTHFFGDSQRALAEVDVLAFGAGLALGLLVGLVPVPLPGGLTFRLGLAGGPLVVALTLGALGRTGPVVWTLPYGANLTLRQFGLVLFLAGVGTRSGYAFVRTLAGGSGLGLFVAGLGLTLTTSLLTLLVGHKLLKIPLAVLFGVVAGVHTQPAALAFAAEQTGGDLPNLGYATVFPVATVAKIVLVQILLAVLG